MQLTVTGHHIDVTEALRNYVDKRLAKLERHFDHMTDIHCILTVEKLRHKAEATVHVGGGTIHAGWSLCARCHMRSACQGPVRYGASIV